ncbi:DUF4124 domain-containing protein [Roseateles sp.]|uniref:DUF4124 domain-containing protein n=1 Tax=Roseateles sp. TaxID=1971397 RepID=UPI003BA7CFB2
MSSSSSFPARPRLATCLLTALLALAALSAAAPAQAQWKWRDASGKLQFSDLPPPQGTPDKDIIQRPAKQVQNVVIVPYGQPPVAATPSPKAASAPDKAEQDRQAKLKQQDQAAETKKKAEESQLAEQRRDNCQRAQDNLKLLQDGVRLTKTNERGETVHLDERQRAEEIQRSRTVMNSECR